MITFLANQFKPVDIKVAFAALIGKVGGSAITAFLSIAISEGLTGGKIS